MNLSTSEQLKMKFMTPVLCLLNTLTSLNGKLKLLNMNWSPSAFSKAKIHNFFIFLSVFAGFYHVFMSSYCCWHHVLFTAARWCTNHRKLHSKNVICSVQQSSFTCSSCSPCHNDGAPSPAVDSFLWANRRRATKLFLCKMSTFWLVETLKEDAGVNCIFFFRSNKKTCFEVMKQNAILLVLACVTCLSIQLEFSEKWTVAEL